MLDPLLFLIYMNDLADGLSPNAKLFADDTSLFSVIHNDDTSANQLNNDLYQINKWAFQWKRALTQTQVNRPNTLFLVEKLRKFVILRYILITALSRNLHIKSILAYF